MTANIFVLALIISTVFVALTAEERKNELEVVQAVDLSRYVGRILN